MTKLLLIRHGDCDGVGEILWGRTPGVNLNERGQAQVRELANGLADVRLEAIYASPLARTMETASAIANKTAAAVIARDTLNEFDFGDWTGRSIETMNNAPGWREFNEFRSTTRAPGGESMLEVQVRMVVEVLAIASRHTDSTVALVGHSDPIRAALTYFVGSHIDHFHRLELSPASFSLVQMKGAAPTVVSINNTFGDRAVTD